jgi:hypothetical protein
MAWIDVHIIEFGALKETGDASGARASASVKYYVEADAAFTMDQAMSASYGTTPNVTSIPALGASYSTTRPNCTCRGRQVDFVSPTQAYVTCDFSDMTDGSSTEALAGKPARYSSATEQLTWNPPCDARGNKLVNKAGAPFDNPPTMVTAISVFTIRKYVSAQTKAAIHAAANTVNDHQVTVDGSARAIGTCWLYGCEFEAVATDTCWEATVVIKFNPFGWKVSALNVGYRDATGAEIKVVKDNNGTTVGCFAYVGEPITSPWPLDDDGNPKPAGSSGNPPVADPIDFYNSAENPWTGVPLI